MGERVCVCGKSFDEERALYGLTHARVERCRFEGPADGESALKEAADLEVVDCDFLLRYPLWHVSNARVARCRMTPTCRAALWYDRNLTFEDCELGGIKALRECDETSLVHCRIDSAEFGWMCRGVRMRDCALASEYPFLHASDLDIDGLSMKAKYSFQYVEGATLRNCTLDTKDAFWHSRGVTVYDSVIKGEYLAWYSHDLRLVRCHIVGTQPLCYARGLVLEDCTMEGCDLAFERSDVQVSVRGHIESVKNPLSGFVKAGSIGEVILDGTLPQPSTCEISC